MLDFKNKKVVSREIEKVKAELESAKGLFTIAILKDDLQYLQGKLNSL